MPRFFLRLFLGVLWQLLIYQGKQKVVLTKASDVVHEHFGASNV